MRGCRLFDRDGQTGCGSGVRIRKSAAPEFCNSERRRFVKRRVRNLHGMSYPFGISEGYDAGAAGHENQYRRTNGEVRRGDPTPPLATDRASADTHRNTRDVPILVTTRTLNLPLARRLPPSNDPHSVLDEICQVAMLPSPLTLHSYGTHQRTFRPASLQAGYKRRRGRVGSDGSRRV